jgi:hypothetical protein
MNLPSGLTAIPRGRFPAGITPVTVSVAVSMMEIVPDFSFGT